MPSHFPQILKFVREASKNQFKAPDGRTPSSRRLNIFRRQPPPNTWRAESQGAGAGAEETMLSGAVVTTGNKPLHTWTPSPPSVPPLPSCPSQPMCQAEKANKVLSNSLWSTMN